ncbi:MAG: hypothetical protein ACK55I_36655, partial [bacterium]
MAHVDLVDHGVFGPVRVKGVGRFFGGLGGAGGSEGADYGKSEELLHGLLVGFEVNKALGGHFSLERAQRGLAGYDPRVGTHVVDANA